MKRTMLFIILSLGAILLFGVSDLFAAGTPAGTVISSRAKATYTTLSGTVTDSAFSNIVSVTVAQVAAVNATPSTNSVTTTSDSVHVDYAITITNSGNGKDKFSLSKGSTKSWTVDLYHDINGNGVLDAADSTAGAITATDSVKADSSYMIVARVFVPRDQSLNGQSDVTTVTATSDFDNSKTASSVLTTTVHTVNFSNIGTGLTVDNASPSAGQNVTYTFTITNNGAVAATGVAFADPLSGFTYVSSTTTQGSVNSSGNPILWTIGTINPASSVTITITLNVPSGASNGAIFNNVIEVTYTAGSNTFTSTSNSRSVTVTATYNVAISPSAASSAKEPEDSIKYYFALKNTGNKKDVLEVSFSSSKSLSWKFYKDINDNGIYDAGDIQLTNTNGYAGADADSVQFSDSVHVIAIVTVPSVSTDQDNDVTTFTVTSAGDNAKSQSSIATTTFDVAVISVTKVVAPIGNQPPGQTMTYTINFVNNGHGKAYNFKIIDGAPDSTTYVSWTVKLNTVLKTDASGDDEVTVTNGGKTITVDVGTLVPAASGTIEFKITVN